MELEIRLIQFGSPQYQDTLTLRDQVLRRPLGLKLADEDTKHDHEQIHLGAFSKETLCGCLTLAPQNARVVKMRQVAVDPEYQKMGFGRQLVLAAEKEAQQRLFSRITLNARETALPFYLKLGYEIEGKPLVEVRIPHRLMAKDLKIPMKQRCLVITKDFLRIGLTAFGGPAAHISIMEEDFVRRKKWLTKLEFLDLIALTNLIPGPNSTEMAIHIGYQKGGWSGLIYGGLAFILPAFILVWAFAFFYVKYGYLPALQSVLLGVKPVIIAVIAQAVWSLSKSAVKTKFHWFLLASSIAAYFALGKEILILIIAAGINWVWNFTQQSRDSSLKLWLLNLGSLSLLKASKVWAAATNLVNPSQESLFLLFLKIGSVLFGSGYVLVAFLQTELVEKLHWVTQQQLFDALSVGQFTPGPVFTTATFIGYVVAGPLGAIMATTGIFLPAFFFVGLTVLALPYFHKTNGVRSVLDGLNVASLALMAGVAALLVYQNQNSPYVIVGFMAALVLLIRFKVNSMWLMILGGALGWMFL